MADDIRLDADILVIGGGTAGSVAAIKAKEALPNGTVLLLEKANVKRSGAIALGMDGVNNAIIPGHATPFYKELTGPNGPVFLKMNHLAPETVAEIGRILHTTERPSRGRFHAGRGTDYGEQLVEMAVSEIGLCSGHSASGVWVNERVKALLGDPDTGVQKTAARALGQIESRTTPKA